MFMLQITVQNLRHNRKRLVSDLIEIVKLVLSTSESKEMNFIKLKQKLETITGKKERLLDLYLEQDISREEYHRMTEHYDMDIANLQDQIKETQKREETTVNHEEMINDIAVTIWALTLGEKQDDTFYRNIVEKIVVHSREHIDIYLNLLPCKWSYKLAELPEDPGKKRH